jgi:hypothetical protein
MFNRVERFRAIEDDGLSTVRCSWFCISESVVPEMYEINAGRMGNIHGEKNDPAPASADTSTFAVSTAIPTQAMLCTFC